MAETVYYVDTDVVGGAGDGSSWANAYSSLNAAESARNADITAGDAVVFSCRGATNADSTTVMLSGWTTDADSYISIVGDAEDRHSGTWSGSKYRIIVTNNPALYIIEDYCRIDGVQLQVSSGNANYQYTVDIEGIAASNDLRISNCIIRGHNNGTYLHSGIGCLDSDIKLKIWNSIVYDVATASNCYCIAAEGTLDIYSCTCVGGAFSIRVFDAATATCKNVYAGGSSTQDLYKNPSGTLLAKVNCASEDTSATETDTGITATNCITGVAPDTDTFVNVTAGSQNFHLAADGNSPLQDAGAAPGGAAPLDYTTDIDGETISTWSIGADSIAAAGLTSVKTIEGLAFSSVKTVQGVVVASIKSLQGMT